MSSHISKGNSPLIRVVCRSSKLSLLQVNEVFAQFPNINYTVNAQESFGDKNKNISLMSKEVTTDFFTREMDDEILCGNADIAIHSAKDLPCPIPEGIEVIALLDAFDKTDSLVSRSKLTLAQLPAGSRIGTSSATRKAELLDLRPDVEVVSIRGTIDERIAQVESGYVDALIVATCALKRLGLTDQISEVLGFRTHPLQGNIAITAAKGSPFRSLFEPKNAKRQHVLVTGTTCEEYKNLGVIIHQPLIKISGVDNKKQIHEALDKLSGFQWVIFTSRYGVRYFFKEFEEKQLPLSIFDNIKIASVGKTTSSELIARGLTPTVESPTESAEGLVDYFKNKSVSNKNILLPRSAIGLKYLTKELAGLGNNICDLAVYNNTASTNTDKLDLSIFHKIVFASPSGVKAFKHVYGEIPDHIQIITKGKTTEEYLKNNIK